MLKSISKLVVNPLVYIYSLSIEQSIFPDTLKVADVKPLFKNGDKSIMRAIFLRYLKKLSKPD